MHLLLMKGHPATGKSTLSQALARQLQCPLLDKDDIKDHTLSLPNGNFLAYDILWQVAETQLRLGLTVIIDTPLAYPIGYETGSQLAARYDAQLLVVEAVLDEPLWHQRLDERPSAESLHRISSREEMQRLLKRYNGCWQYPIDPAHLLRVDTSLSVEELVARVVQRMA